MHREYLCLFLFLFEAIYPTGLTTNLFCICEFYTDAFALCLYTPVFTYKLSRYGMRQDSYKRKNSIFGANCYYFVFVRYPDGYWVWVQYLLHFPPWTPDPHSSFMFNVKLMNDLEQRSTLVCIERRKVLFRYDRI